MRSQQHELLFCDNETNVERLYAAKAAGYFKDAFHEYLVRGNHGAVNPLRRGTKAAVHYVLQVREVERRRFACGFPPDTRPSPLQTLPIWRRPACAKPTSITPAFNRISPIKTRGSYSGRHSPE